MGFFGKFPAVLAALAALPLLLPAPVLAQDTLSPGENQQQYAACMVLVDQSPDQALESAIEWEKQGGGDAAKHCQALALIGLKRYDDAAFTLEQIAQTLPQVKAPLAAQAFAQAAQAWRLAGKDQLALHDMNEGLSLAPQDVDLLVDRAALYGESGMFFEALDDLNAAVDLAPSRADIYVYRASTYIDLNELELAGDNLNKALDLAPDYPEALLQRGRLRAVMGEKDAARADLMKVLEIAPKSAIAEAAQRQLEKIDITGN
jgi:tetratricopeptide (TPR) repeat protein